MATLNYQTRAINAINPSAQFRSGKNIETIEWLHGTTPISLSDINTKADELKVAEDAAVAQEATDKANANQKLLDLGLTQAEVDTFKK